MCQLSGFYDYDPKQKNNRKQNQESWSTENENYMENYK